MYTANCRRRGALEEEDPSARDFSRLDTVDEFLAAARLYADAKAVSTT